MTIPVLRLVTYRYRTKKKAECVDDRDILKVLQIASAMSDGEHMPMLRVVDGRKLHFRPLPQRVD